MLNKYNTYFLCAEMLFTFLKYNFDLFLDVLSVYIIPCSFLPAKYVVVKCPTGYLQGVTKCIDREAAPHQAGAVFRFVPP